jgi:beta-1,4-mannosyl-glycoprotein beta-1,4-N-acetylglucosaminyltransferase
MLFIDTFLFNGDWITQLRLKYLSPFVDFFYIVESRYTFSGVKKDVLYKDIYADWFRDYKDKVRFIVSESSPFPNSWHEERRIRGLATEHISRDFEGQDYMVAFCDADEVYDISRLPSKEELRAIGKEKVIFPEMNLYYYRFTHRIPGYSWVMPFFIHSSQFHFDLDVDEMRVNKKRDGAPAAVHVIHGAGWHFSYFSGLEEIRRKIQSFAHTDLNTEENTSDQNISKALREGVDLFRRNLKIDVIPVEDASHNYPSWFAETQAELETLQTA